MTDNDEAQAGQPLWVTWIRQDIANVNKRIDTLVSKDSFQQEQKRVDDKFRELGRELGDVKGDLQKEAQARVTQAITDQKERTAEKDQQQKVAAQTRWQWFALVAVPVVAYIINQVLPVVNGP